MELIDLVLYTCRLDTAVGTPGRCSSLPDQPALLACRLPDKAADWARNGSDSATWSPQPSQIGPLTRKLVTGFVGFLQLVKTPARSRSLWIHPCLVTILTRLKEDEDNGAISPDKIGVW